MKTRVAPSLSLSRLWGPAFALGAALGLCVASAPALSDDQHGRMPREQAEAPANGGDVGSTSSAPAARTNRHLVFKLPDLPDGLQWTRDENPDFAEHGLVMFVVKGYTESTSPVRVIYQRLITNESPAAVRDGMLAPLEQCPGRRVEEFRGVSRHPEQLNVEAHCPKLGAKDSGLISQIALFKDSDFTHVVVGETRIALPGGEERAERLAGLLREAVRNIRSCDEAKNCL